MASTPLVYSGATPDSLPAAAAKINANVAALEAADAAEATARASADTAEASSRAAGDLASLVFAESVVRRAVANHVTAPNNGLSNGTDTGATYRLRHVAPTACADLSLLFGNFTSTNETDGNADITVRASIEYPVGTYTRVWFAGSRDVVLKPGGTAESEPVGIDLPAGAIFYTRTYVTVASVGQKWPRGMMTVASRNEGGNSSPTPSDQTTSGSITALATASYGPYCIRGRAPSPHLAAVLLVGDSIIAGVGATDSYADLGFVPIALNDTLVHSSIAQTGEQAQGFVAAHAARMRSAGAHTYAVCNYGTNDIALGSRTLAQVQADLVTIWTMLRTRSLTTYQCTLLPRTTSTDAWATTGNQTPATGFAIGGTRQQLNDWIRDGSPIDATTKVAVAVGTVTNAIRAGSAAHPLAGYFETADTVESARNSGVFKAPGYTTDGIHPTQTGHVAMAAAITLAVFV